MLLDRKKQGLFYGKRNHWAVAVFALRGRPWPLWALLWYVAYCSTVVSLCVVFWGSSDGEPYTSDYQTEAFARLSTTSDTLSYLGIAVFLLLAFRCARRQLRCALGANCA
jgi:hypothetical protein